MGTLIVILAILLVTFTPLAAGFAIWWAFSKYPKTTGAAIVAGVILATLAFAHFYPNCSFSAFDLAPQC